MTPKIVLSYRRADTGAITGRIDDRLVEQYGREQIFRDIDNIPIGSDFRTVISDTMQGCDVVLAIVGPDWIGRLTDGHTRIENDDDVVRAEIELAMQARVTIMPVLIDGATMPNASELPDAIKKFSNINAAFVDSGRDFHHHVDRLIKSINQILAEIGKTPPPLKHGNQPKLFPMVSGLLTKPSTLTTGGMLALPLAASYASLAPPAPSTSVAIAIAIFGQIVSLLIAARHLASTMRRNINRLMVGGIIVLALASLVYLWALSAYTFEIPTSKERQSKGFVCSTNALIVYGNKCPSLGDDDLREAEYVAERLWTAQSIAIVNVGLLTLWTLSFVSLAIVVTCLLALQI